MVFFKQIIISIDFSPENYIKILEETNSLKLQLENKNYNNYTNDFILLQIENKKLKIDNLNIVKKYNVFKNINQIPDEIPTQAITQQDILHYDNTINKFNTHFTKNKDGTYNIDGKIFFKMFGSRIDVWNGKAYKTTGKLIKSDLMLHKSGKVISKKKCIQETLFNRFEKSGVNKTKQII